MADLPLWVRSGQMPDQHVATTTILIVLSAASLAFVWGWFLGW
jgi:hypothetical protein